MPSNSAHVKNEKQETLKHKGMSEQRAAKVADSPDASRKGGTRGAATTANESGS